MNRNIKLIEIDNGIINSSQRNNEFVYNNNQLHINSFSTCNVTSMCMALRYLNYKFPEGDFDQPEDNLAKFMVENTKVNSFYQKNFPSMYNEYIMGNKNCYSPMEIHSVLSYAVNLWLDKDVTEFIEKPTETFDKVLKSNLENGKPLVVSGVFNGLNHIVCVPGIITIDDNVEFVKIDDPYGNFRRSYKEGSGNDIWLTYEEAKLILKPKDSEYKMYHRFN